MVRMSVLTFIELAEDIKKDMNGKNIDEYEICLRDVDLEKWHACIYQKPGYSII